MAQKFLDPSIPWDEHRRSHRSTEKTASRCLGKNPAAEFAGCESRAGYQTDQKTRPQPSATGFFVVTLKKDGFLKKLSEIVEISGAVLFVVVNIFWWCF